MAIYTAYMCVNNIPSEQQVCVMHIKNIPSDTTSIVYKHLNHTIRYNTYIKYIFKAFDLIQQV